MAAARPQGFHEDLTRSQRVKAPTERNFGLTFTAVFAIIAGLMAWKGSYGWAAGFAGGALAFLALTFAAPSVLRPLNFLWLKFGLLLHRIVNPIVMGFLFFAVITPFGVVMRLAGKDLLSLRRGAAFDSYWVKRDAPGPAPETMSQQF